MHKQLIGIGIIILLLNATFGYFVYQNNQKRLVSERYVQHTMIVRFEINELKNLQKQFENLLITNYSSHTDFLASLKNTQNEMFETINQLINLTKDNPSQHRQFILIRAYLKFINIESLKATPINPNFPGYKAEVELPIWTAKPFMDAIYNHISNVQLEEEKLLQKRKLKYVENVNAFTRINVMIFTAMAGFTILLLLATKKIYVQTDEKNRREGELTIANKALTFENDQKEKRADELVIAGKELVFQNKEKYKRAAELVIANRELSFQNEEKEKRAKELIVANKELIFQNEEKEKRAQELIVANEELIFQNNEKGKRALELKEAVVSRTKIVQDLSQRNKDLEQFAYIVSHNLRAPVANIIGASTMLNDAEVNVADKETLKILINDSVMKLDRVIKDLNHILEVKTIIDSHKEVVNFSQLVEDIKASIKRLIDKNKITIDYDFSEANQLLILKPYLYSIFYNLITNSIKYRKPDVTGIITIKSKQLANKIILSFCDNGMGINLNKNGEEVFGLYKRFHQHIEGKGMGLYMVKLQVEALGGNIKIESRENEGAEFIVTLIG